MTRFFFVPAVIVLLCVGVFVLFGLIASEGRSARDYLEEIRHGTTNRRWQAAYELSRLLSRRRGAPSDPRLAADVADLLGNPKVDEPLVRRYLILALDGIGDPSVRPAVEAALADPDPEVRLYAARALGTLGDEGSDAALAALLEDPDPSLRKMALHSLGRIGAPGAAAAVRPRLEDPVEDVRWNAALTLAVLGDGSGARVLQQMMDPAHLDRVEGITEAQKIEARINAVQAAFRLREPGLRGDVERLSRTDASLKVRDVALKALAAWR
jgi:HEAT repeat protein